MKCGRSSQGFTIVETMIFLAVSGALLLAAMTFITSSQNGTQFKQGANDALQEVNKVINNVANGYFAGDDSVVCTVNPARTAVTAGVDASSEGKGTNKDCVFLGRVIEFGAPGSTAFTVRDVAGVRTLKLSSGAITEPTTMREALPALISGTQQEVALRYGLKFGSLKRATTGGSYSSAGFFSRLGKIAGTPESGNLESTAQQFDFIGYSDFSTDINDASYESKRDSIMDEGLELCLHDGSRQAIITIGGPQRSSTTTLTINDGDCSP